jgi:hypothetical protein
VRCRAAKKELWDNSIRINGLLNMEYNFYDCGFRQPHSLQTLPQASPILFA